MDYKKSISIIIVFLFVVLCDGDRMLTFYEENNLSPQQIVTYSDNTLVFRLVERLNATCNVPNLIFRILYPNGTSNLIAVSNHGHQFPPVNFCNKDTVQHYKIFKFLIIYISGTLL